MAGEGIDGLIAEVRGQQLVPRRLTDMPTRRTARQWLEAALNGVISFTVKSCAAAAGPSHSAASKHHFPDPDTDMNPSSIGRRIRL